MFTRFIAFIFAALLALQIGTGAQAQEAQITDRSATGGAQTLADILARQEGLKIDDSFRSDNLGGTGGSVPALGTRGSASDPDLWRAIRYGKADAGSQTNGSLGPVLIQDGGMAWYEFRAGPLSSYGGYLLLGTIAALALFYILRGRIGLDAQPTGRTITRFKAFERFSHWLLAGSFILLGITGLASLFGRKFIIPLMGHEANSTLLIATKFIHNNVSWAFMLALVFVFFLWVWHNIPDRTDITWFAQAGGIVGKKHPPAKKFNGGQKIIFWSVIVLGASISASGLSLLFPFDMLLFAKSFALFNDLGLPQMLGAGELPVALAPQEEMQLAQAWHAIVSFVLMAIIIAHIYIGSIGMEGAFDAMGSGEVDEAWARQHHSIWVDEVTAKETPAE